VYAGEGTGLHSDAVVEAGRLNRSPDVAPKEEIRELRLSPTTVADAVAALPDDHGKVAEGTTVLTVLPMIVRNAKPRLTMRNAVKAFRTSDAVSRRAAAQ